MRRPDAESSSPSSSRSSSSVRRADVEETEEVMVEATRTQSAEGLPLGVGDWQGNAAELTSGETSHHRRCLRQRIDHTEDELGTDSD